jgi:hypothetical protein
MKKELIIFLFIFLINFISASCDDGQIDINSASKEELDKIKWVGESTAQNIINARPFNSVDDLIKVTYIGQTKLDDIKNEGLACVSDDDEEVLEIDEEESEDETEELEEEQENEDEDKIVDSIDDKMIKLNSEISENKTKDEKKFETIELNVVASQNIKSEDYKKSLSKENYAKYGLGLFCVFVCN